MSSLGKKVADSMLHRAQTIKIADEEFAVAPPVMETLILVSEQISEIPSKEFAKSEMIYGALAQAKYYRPMANAIAIMILGANGLEKTSIISKMEEVVNLVPREVETKYLFGLIKKKRIIEVEERRTVETHEEVKVDEMARVSKLLRYNKSNKDILDLFKQLMEGLQVGDFFVLLSILQEINLMKTTTPAPGQSPQE